MTVHKCQETQANPLLCPERSRDERTKTLPPRARFLPVSQVTLSHRQAHGDLCIDCRHDC